MALVVESRLFDPRTDKGASAHAFVGCEACDGPAAASRTALALLRMGYWVEVRDAATSEVLAGPFDPDQKPPKYVF